MWACWVFNQPARCVTFLGILLYPYCRRLTALLAYFFEWISTLKPMVLANKSRCIRRWRGVQCGNLYFSQQAGFQVEHIKYVLALLILLLGIAAPQQTASAAVRQSVCAQKCAEHEHPLGRQDGGCAASACALAACAAPLPAIAAGACLVVPPRPAHLHRAERAAAFSSTAIAPDIPPPKS